MTEARLEPFELAPCEECGGTDLIGPFEMDGYAGGVYRPRGLWWTVCRGCGRSELVADRASAQPSLTGGD